MSETDEIANSVENNADTSDSFYDREYLMTGQSQLSAQQQLAQFITIETSPEALADDSLIQFKPWKIYDADGDGVEDNEHMTPEQLDKFYIPNNFFPTENIYNTRNGNLPGHIQRGYYEIQKEPASMELVKHEW